MQQEALQGDSYITLAETGRSLLKEKGSKFIGLAVPVAHPAAAEEQLNRLKKEQPGANHHCFAYRTQPLAPQIRFNDDGEPSNSAGKPIYNQIVACNYWNVMVVVTRFFGGTKLGVSGLISAYKKAAQEALLQGSTKKIIFKANFEIRFPYEHTKLVLGTLEKCGAKIAEEKMDVDAGFEVKVRLNQKKAAIKMLSKLPFVTIVENA
jgi:putative IMPACT (imprinted ancient) family translation regulator